MKKIIALIFVVASLPVFASDSLDTKIVRKFSLDFPNAENVNWFEKSGIMEVYYTASDVSCRIWYAANGEVIRTRRYYSEKDLAPYLRSILSQAYPDKKIFGITESSTANKVDYSISLQNDNSWIILTCNAMGEITRVQEMNK
ncbi:MAG: hypothetical protein ABWZ25_11260 [Chitinophagaceae bacterium]